MQLLNNNIVENIQNLSQENKEISSKIDKIKATIKEKNINEDDINRYKKDSLPTLVIKDIMIIIFGFAILAGISAALSATGFLAPIIAIIWGLILLGLAFHYFKVILITVILSGVLWFVLEEMSITNETDIFVFNGLLIIAIFIIARTNAVIKNRNMINDLSKHEDTHKTNTKNILNLLLEPLNNYIQSAGLVDIKSLQENGFSFVEEKYLAKHLKYETIKGNLKTIKLPQSDTIVYKSTKFLPNNEEMATTHLQID